MCLTESHRHGEDAQSNDGKRMCTEQTVVDLVRWHSGNISEMLIHL